MANDNAALARAIDEAEEHQLIVHAAHMRIVLAKRTGDLSRLARTLCWSDWRAGSFCGNCAKPKKYSRESKSLSEYV